MAGKPVKANLKMKLKGGQASAAPPVGSGLQPASRLADRQERETASAHRRRYVAGCSIRPATRGSRAR